MTDETEHWYSIPKTKRGKIKFAWNIFMFVFFLAFMISGNLLYYDAYQAGYHYCKAKQFVNMSGTVINFTMPEVPTTLGNNRSGLNEEPS